MKVALSLLVIFLTATSAFLSPRKQQQTGSCSLLFGYRHEWGEGGGGGGGESSDIHYGNELDQQRPKPRGLTIPVLPAIPNALPLLMGSELLLDPPTPGQWQAMEESLALHQQYLKGANLTAIDAAPVVAVIDEYTATPDEPG